MSKCMSVFKILASVCQITHILTQTRGHTLTHIVWAFNSVQFSSVTQSCPTLWNTMDCSMPGFPVHNQITELTQIHVHWVCDAIQPSHPLSSPFPPAFNLSQSEDLSSESVLHIRWPKYWSSSLNIIPSSEYSGLIYFRIDWLDLLSIQGTLKSLLQHYSSKHQFFGVQLSLQSNSHIHTWLLEKL